MKILILYALILSGFSVFAQGNEKRLIDIGKFSSESDTIGQCLLDRYSTLNVMEVTSDRNFLWYVHNKPVFRGKFEGFSYYIQIFDTAFLIVSVYKGISPAAVPDNFSRDSTYIIDLKSGAVKFAPATGYLFVGSKSSLLANYDILRSKDAQKFRVHASIDSIDFTQSEIKVFTQNRVIETILLEAIP